MGACAHDSTRHCCEYSAGDTRDVLVMHCGGRGGWLLQESHTKLLQPRSLPHQSGQRQLLVMVAGTPLAALNPTHCAILVLMHSSAAAASLGVVGMDRVAWLPQTRRARPG